MIKDAYFSYQGASRCGFCTYKREDGKEIAITEIINVGRKPGSKWKDLEYVGRVVKWTGTYRFESIIPKSEPQPKPELEPIVVHVFRDIEL
jgi:hypothetical protein